MSCHVCFGSSGGLGVLMPAVPMPAVPMPAVPMPGSADESQELFPGAASLASHGVEFVEREASRRGSLGPCSRSGTGRKRWLTEREGHDGIDCSCGNLRWTVASF